MGGAATVHKDKEQAEKGQNHIQILYTSVINHGLCAYK